MTFGKFIEALLVQIEVDLLACAEHQLAELLIIGKIYLSLTFVCDPSQSMCQHPPLTEWSADQLMAHAMDYRRMALSAATVETREALIGLATRLVALAIQRKQMSEHQ
jgi:hypothetical protein